MTTVGVLKPLTFERYRICELYAELLHCSNMSLLNRPAEFNHLYDSEGRLQGGLSSLEELAQVIAIGAGNDHDDDDIDDENDDMEPAHEFPVSAAHTASLDSDDDMSDEAVSSDDDAMEEIAMYEEHRPPDTSSMPEAPLERFPSATLSSSPMTSPSPHIASLTPIRRSSGSDSESLSRPRSRDSRRSQRRSTTTDKPPNELVLGERLKKRFLDVNVAATLLVRTLITTRRTPVLTPSRTYFLSFRGIISCTASCTTTSIKFLPAA